MSCSVLLKSASLLSSSYATITFKWIEMLEMFDYQINKFNIKFMKIDHTLLLERTVT